MPSRALAAQQGAAQPETIPAATAERCGQTRSVPDMVNRVALRPVLGTSRVDATETDPEALYRQAARTSASVASEPNSQDRREAPVPPLKSYAAVPSEITAEIQRLRQENADLKAELAEQEKKQSPEERPEAAVDPVEKAQEPRQSSAPASSEQPPEHATEDPQEEAQEVSG
ncbi:hypothetical protein [Aliiruegeria sabulilitoris]|uniref:hypothetical protein n=1 Tax=Aliiruegeria sabulilitoris TaxID=1510458 RepID=UPI000829684E|nr:hypothetical protein [Aliiruegeria sabulilitoris]NDR55784.1 hypothetical protein [Pseudoruegeria sp. M32A2M]